MESVGSCFSRKMEALPMNQFIISNTTAQMFKNAQKTSTTTKVGSVIPVLLWVTAGSAAL